jgi:hypothetical protein
MINPIDLAKACLQMPLPWSPSLSSEGANQHRHQPLLLVEDQYAFFIEACRNADGQKPA